MCHPFKHFKHWKQKVFLVLIGLVLLKTLFCPNPLDILILVGLILVFVGFFGDDFH